MHFAPAGLRHALARRNDDDRISYLALRKAIGIIGLALPFALVLGKLLVDGPGLESSMSAYYYTEMRDVFVGSMCAIGIFLLSYRGPERADDLAGDLACVCAVGLALFPTSPEDKAETWVNALHFVFAATLFATFAFFSIVLFRKTKPGVPLTPTKQRRRVIYAVCGWTIVGCIAAIVLVKLMPESSPIHRLDPVLWLEALAVLAFGSSWLTKGLKDA